MLLFHHGCKQGFRLRHFPVLMEQGVWDHSTDYQYQGPVLLPGSWGEGERLSRPTGHCLGNRGPGPLPSPLGTTAHLLTGRSRLLPAD